MIELSVSWFRELPFIFQLTLLGLLLAAVQQFRQGYIGRVAIAGSAILIVQYAYPRWPALPEIWQLYTIIAAVFGIIAGVSYLDKQRLPTEFYKASLLLYGAAPTALILLFGFPL